MMGVEFDAASTMHMFAAVAAAGALYLAAIRSGANMERCLLVSVGLVVGMGFYVLRFVRNRPAHYAIDWATSFLNPHRARPRAASSHPYIIPNNKK